MREHDLELLGSRLEEIKEKGWIKNQRPGNAGGVGNTLEDLLDVAENNLQIPDFGEWELKTQRKDSKSLLTLFHCEPSPTNMRIVPQLLLPYYGWSHQKAGIEYGPDEKSFRQTLNAITYSDRGFIVIVDREEERIYISFDYSKIDERHSAWKEYVEKKIGKNDLQPNPYWTFQDISEKINKKLKNLMYITAERKYENGEEFFKYDRFEAYIDPTLNNFISLLEQGYIYVDFDARTGHNHGTKFRIKPLEKENLYQQFVIVKKAV